MNTRFYFSLLAISCLAACSTGATSTDKTPETAPAKTADAASNKTPNATADKSNASEMEESLTVTPMQGPMTKEHARRLSKLTEMAVGRIHSAEKSMDEKNYENAETLLKKSDEIMSVVKAEMPSAVITKSIIDLKDGLEASSVSEIQSNLVPVYERLSEIEGYMPVPVKRAKKHLDISKASLARNDKAGAKKGLEMAVTDLNLSMVDVRVDKMRSMISKAEADLGKKKYRNAKREIEKSRFLAVVSDDLFMDPMKKQ